MGDDSAAQHETNEESPTQAQGTAAVRRQPGQACLSGEKPGRTGREKLAFPRRFSRFFGVPWAVMLPRTQTLQRHTTLEQSLTPFRSHGARGIIPLAGGLGDGESPKKGAKKPP